jgi:4'-phosphopantetheinyl transferase
MTSAVVKARSYEPSAGFVLEPGRTDLWLSYVADLAGDNDRHAYRKTLSADELLRESRFRFPADRDLYLIARTLTRSVLGRYCAVNPQDVVFERGCYGRPTLSLLTPECGRVSFSLSHTRGLVMMAVGCDREVGVDVEMSDRAVGLEVAEQAFAPQEVADLLALPPRDRPGRLLEYWTLKECYAKARSMGLYLPFDRFAFKFYSDDDKFGLSLEPELLDTPHRWQFFQFRVFPDFIGAFCTSVHPDEMTRIYATRVSPNLQTATPAPIIELRRSRHGEPC